MKPILFNTEMVRAILEGRKTVTRRVINMDMVNKLDYEYADGHYTPAQNLCRYKVGDVLYVRETWIDWSCAECDCECVGDNGYGHCDMPKYLYKASHEETDKGWKPSIHMPKAAARIFLKVSSVRVERLQDMTEEQASKEGAIDNRGFIHSPDNEYTDLHTAREDFIRIWDSTIKPDQLKYYGWEANPYVWVIEFERVEGKCSD